MRSLTEIKFNRLGTIAGNDNFGLVTLTDMSESAGIGFVCDEMSIRQIGLRLSGNGECDRMLPEVLLDIVRGAFDVTEFRIVVNALVDGEYKAKLITAANYDGIDIRLSDAVVLSLASEIPIYIDSVLFLQQAVPFDRHSERLSIPINTLPKARLEKELQKAIEQEDYRLASNINEELKRRGDSECDMSHTKVDKRE